MCIQCNLFFREKEPTCFSSKFGMWNTSSLLNFPKQHHNYVPIIKMTRSSRFFFPREFREHIVEKTTWGVHVLNLYIYIHVGYISLYSHTFIGLMIEIQRPVMYLPVNFQNFIIRACTSSISRLIVHGTISQSFHPPTAALIVLLNSFQEIRKIRPNWREKFLEADSNLRTLD